METNERLELLQHRHGLVTVQVSGHLDAAIVQRASPEEDALAKTYQTNPSKAGIYIYRNDRAVASKMSVLLNNVWVGDNVPKTYIFRQVDAGTHVITSWTENDATTTLDAKAGNNYFVWQELKGGPFAPPRGSELHWLTKPQERRGSRSASWWSQVRPNKALQTDRFGFVCCGCW